MNPGSAGNAFFSSMYETFSKIDAMLGHKANFNTFQTVEVTVYGYSGIKPEINNKNECNDDKIWPIRVFA